MDDIKNITESAKESCMKMTGDAIQSSESDFDNAAYEEEASAEQRYRRRQTDADRAEDLAACSNCWGEDDARRCTPLRPIRRPGIPLHQYLRGRQAHGGKRTKTGRRSRTRSPRQVAAKVTASTAQATVGGNPPPSEGGAEGPPGGRFDLATRRRILAKARSGEMEEPLPSEVEPFLDAFVDLIVEDLIAYPPKESE